MDHFEHIVGTTQQWRTASYKEKIIPRGVLCIELCDEKTTKLKVGVGNKHFEHLPYIEASGDFSDYYTKEEVNNLLTNLDRMKIASTTIYDTPESLPKNKNNLGDVRFVKNPTGSDNPVLYVWDEHKWVPMSSDQHTHPNKSILDQITEPFKVEDRTLLNQLERDSHTHANKSILDQTTAPFTAPDKEKLDELVVMHPGEGLELDTDHNLNIKPATEDTLGGIKVGNNLSITPDGTLSATIDDLYTEIEDTSQFNLLHTKPADWDDDWTKYYRLDYEQLFVEPEHFNPTKHYKYDNGSIVPGVEGDKFSDYTWYDQHYHGLSADVHEIFRPDTYYSSSLQLLEDGEPLSTSFGKLNTTIEHVEALEQNMVTKNRLADVAFSGDYEDLVEIPELNGIQFKGIHSSLYYNIAKTLFDTKENWDDQPELISEDKVLYFYTDYHVTEGIPGVKLGDGVTPLIDLPVFNPTCKVTDEDIENWNDKVGAVMVPADPERLFLYRNKGDVE